MQTATLIKQNGSTSIDMNMNDHVNVANVDNNTRTCTNNNNSKKLNANKKQTPKKKKSNNDNKDSSSNSNNNKVSNKKNLKCKKKKNTKKTKNQKITQRQQELARLEAEQEISLEEQGKYLALDCEMVGVGEGGTQSALARVSIVDYNNAVLFDTYVKPANDEPVTDYRTFVSGIREEHLRSDLAMGFDQCQSIVKKLLHGKILVGHALKNDLAVLDLDHPWYDCRDTAKYEPFMKRDKATNVLRPRKLRDLAETKLNRIIQIAGQEHCPVEDANAALDLYKKARIKWEKAMEYKYNRTKEIEHENSNDTAMEWNC